jgi:hypothetical protein
MGLRPMRPGRPFRRERKRKTEAMGRQAAAFPGGKDDAGQTEVLRLRITRDGEASFVREKVPRVLGWSSSILRGHMALILTGVLLSGIVANKLLLLLGVTSMPLRYMLAVVCSYAVFFLNVRIWLAYVVDVPIRSSKGSDGAAAGVGDSLPHRSSSAGMPERPPVFGPGGGTFGGGGASASFGEGAAGSETDAGMLPGAPEPTTAPAASKSSSDKGSGGKDLDLGEGAVIVALFVFLLALIFGAAIYMVYDAPGILSDVAFQALLAGGLARPTWKMVGHGWAGSVVRSSWIPFLLVVVMAGLLGSVAHATCTRAKTLVEVLVLRLC